MTQELQRRIDALSEEIRHYPGPIARCDLHLPALIEERAALMEQLKNEEKPGGCTPLGIWNNEGGLDGA
jgi:hypothetical protein